MSKSKDFSITSAERYSLALYELAGENNVLPQVEDQSLAILNLISSSTLLSFASSYKAKENLSAEVIENSLFLLNLIPLLCWKLF